MLTISCIEIVSRKLGFNLKNTSVDFVFRFQENFVVVLY